MVKAVSEADILIITNLFPVPWDPNRASFNRTQFAKLEQYHSLHVVVLVGWLEWLKNRHHLATQASSKRQSVSYCPYFYIPGLARRLVPFFQYLSLLFLLGKLKQLQAKVLLASWGFPDSVAAGKLNKHLNLPMFIKIHGTDINEHIGYKDRRKKIAECFNAADGIFSVSQDLRKKLIDIGVDERKIWVNYNGVDSNTFVPESNAHKNSWLYVGSLIKTKGVDELIEAFVDAKKIIPDVTLQIVGEGPLKTSIIEKVKDENLQACIDVRGSLSTAEVAALIAKASLLILPSYREGVPNVVLEAFSCGIPVVATNVGGIPEVVTGQTGVLVEKQSSKALLKGLLQANNTIWDKAKIIAHAKQFCWQRNIDFARQKMGLL